MNIKEILCKELDIREAQADAAIRLIDDGNTIPFIARYRKEATGSLNDEVLRNLNDRLAYLRNLQEKQDQVIASIDEQGKLTAELKQKILAATTLVAVDDLYRPYRPKRRTRATMAIERGLEPLAEIIMAQNNLEPIEVVAQAYVDAEKEVLTTDDALAGAKDIIAEQISDNPDFRTYIRNITFSKGIISSAASDKDEKTVYEQYYDFEEPISKIAGHRILAINRGEKENILKVKIATPVEDIIRYLKRKIITNERGDTATLLEETITDSYARLIAPSVDREVRAERTEFAEDGAIKVFGKNLMQLLLKAPVTGKVVLGWDPAFRTGCKLAVVDETGKVLDTTVVYPTQPTTPEKIWQAKETVKALVKKYGVSLISLGNGTASRPSAEIIIEIIRELDGAVKFTIVDEAGASVYSASKLASEEFPQFDVGQRSSASIARRLQDPLAELVKIDPKSIGVGQYQHDMNQKKLGDALAGIVENCVNSVGVDLNTASAPLLAYIAGINDTVAKNIVYYREQNGKFADRKQLLKVERLGPKVYEQCAGFLRIKGGKNPLDSTSVHPESYSAAKKLLEKFGFSVAKLEVEEPPKLAQMIDDYQKLAEELSIGEITLRDIVIALAKPGRDPRADAQGPILRTDVLNISDLQEGMVLKGVVRNVIDFGAFVDIGVHQDGLVHISELANKFVKHPLDVVSVGDIVEVRVLSADEKRKRIYLSMKH